MNISTLPPVTQAQLSADSASQRIDTHKKPATEGVTVRLSPEAFEFLQKTKESEKQNGPPDLQEIIKQIKELQQRLSELYQQMATIMASDLPESEKLEQLAPLQEEAMAINEQLQLFIAQLSEMFKES